MLDAGAVAEEGPPNNAAVRRPLRAHRPLRVSAPLPPGGIPRRRPRRAAYVLAAAIKGVIRAEPADVEAAAKDG